MPPSSSPRPAVDRSERPIPFAAVVVVRKGHEVVVLDPTHYRGLSLPGGTSEPGETPLQTATRELWEETGLVLQAAELRAVAKAPDDFQGPVLVFRATRWKGRLRSSREGHARWGRVAELFGRHAAFPAWLRSIAAAVGLDDALP